MSNEKIKCDVYCDNSNSEYLSYPEYMQIDSTVIDGLTSIVNKHQEIIKQNEDMLAIEVRVDIPFPILGDEDEPFTEYEEWYKWTYTVLRITQYHALLLFGEGDFQIYIMV